MSKHSRETYYSKHLDGVGKYPKSLVDSIKYVLVDDLPYKEFPTNSKLYNEAHSVACQEEKKHFPGGYEALKEVEKTMPPKQLLGDNDINGVIRVNRKLVPKEHYTEVAFHEYVEHREIERLAKEKGTDLMGKKF